MDDKRFIKILFGFLLLSLLILSSCTGNPFRRTSVDLQKNYRTGYSGLDISFSRDNRLSEVYESSIIQIIIDAHNKGGYDIRNGMITFSYEREFIDIVGQDNRRINLEGRSEYFSEGQDQRIFLEARTGVISPHVEKDVAFFLRACYPYKIILDDILCIDSPIRRDDDLTLRSCRFRNTVTYSGQGSHVGISKIELKMNYGGSDTLGSPVFDIHLRHNGRGLVTDPDNPLGSCSRSTSEKHNLIKVNEVILADEELICDKEYVQLNDQGEGFFSCTTRNPIYLHMMPYETTFYADLEYGYMLEERINIGIKRR